MTSLTEMVTTMPEANAAFRAGVELGNHKTAIDAALIELQVAEMQMIPKDDAIICQHVRSAIAILKVAQSQMKGGADLAYTLLGLIGNGADHMPTVEKVSA